MFYGYERLKWKRHKPEVKLGLWPSLLRRGDGAVVVVVKSLLGVVGEYPAILK
jgi:hypothetical protein